MKTLFTACAFIIGGLAVVPAHAQFSKPEDAIRYRQSAYVILNHQMGKIWLQLKSPTPDVAVIQRSAAIAEFASRLPGEGFVPGSERGGNPPTRAKPEVFTDAKVGELGREMIAQVAKLNDVAKGGDVSAIRTQFQAAAKTCDNCHDNYRSK
jgi:cytochrome c556